MIRSFADEEARQLWLTGRSRKFGNIARIAARKLEAIDFAVKLEDLRDPPANRLEKLKGDREGQYGIRINDQFRICFEWEGHHAWKVEITGYH